MSKSEYLKKLSIYQALIVGPRTGNMTWVWTTCLLHLERRVLPEKSEVSSVFVSSLVFKLSRGWNVA